MPFEPSTTLTPKVSAIKINLALGLTPRVFRAAFERTILFFELNLTTLTVVVIYFTLYKKVKRCQIIQLHWGMPLLRTKLRKGRAQTRSFAPRDPRPSRRRTVWPPWCRPLV